MSKRITITRVPGATFLVALALTITTLPASPAPPYTVAGNHALDRAASATGFAFMPVLSALEKNEPDTLLCFYTATYHDTLLELFNRLDDALPAKPAPREKEHVIQIKATAWKMKRGAIALSIYCGVQDVYPREWRVMKIKPGDRAAFRRMANETDRTVDALKKLIYPP
jgi:hypothetical protein